MNFQDMIFDEERALYGIQQSKVENCKFDGPADGESVLKECKDITVINSYFNLRYPFWHVDRALIQGCDMTELCRAALWYDQDIVIENTKMNGIKALRECQRIKLKDCEVHSPEFIWRCEDVQIHSTRIASEYPLFETKNIELEDVSLTGKYSFQYVEGGIVRHCNLDTKDAFWHSKNVTIEDSEVKGEYLGWYSENLKLVRCHITGTQPLCYCKGLVLEDCTMDGCDLAFERSEVQATVQGHIDSVKNPAPGGCIKADSIGEQILEPEFCDITRIQITIE